MTPNPVQVLVLSNSLNIGGAQRFAAALLNGLDRKRVRPILALLQDDRGYSLPRDVPVHVLGYASPWALPRAVWKLRSTINNRRPHAVLGVGTSVNLIIGLTLLLLRNRPAWIARVDTHPGRKDLRFRTHLLRWLYLLADVIVANSAGLQKALKVFYPKQAHKIVYLFNPVNFEAMDGRSRERPHWTRREDMPLMVTVGRAYRVKRWDLLLEALARVLRTTPVQLVCCGDGPLLEQLKTKARRMHINDYVHFPGHCPNPFSILARADLFVLSSDAEGLPNALIEAQGLGLCAVSTRCEFGPDEIIADGETGLLVPAGNADQLAHAIRVLAGNASVRTRMGANAREQVRERFDFRSRCREWEDLIVRFGSAPPIPSRRDGSLYDSR